MAAATVKGYVAHPVQYLVTEQNGDAHLFCEFVMFLIEEGALREGDILVVDNCSFHFGGKNTVLEEVLWESFGILMIPLPPYHPELNPVKCVFGHLVLKLRKERTRSTVEEEDEFLEVVERTIEGIRYSTVVSEYQHCGYLKNI